MIEQRQRTPQRDRRADADSSPGAETSGPSDLMQQVRAWRTQARGARESCERGVEAEAEMHRRRNRPGQ